MKISSDEELDDYLESEFDKLAKAIMALAKTVSEAKAPVVNIPPIQMKSPDVNVVTPEVRVDSPVTVEVPQDKSRSWTFDIIRNSVGQITTIKANPTDG